MKISLKKKAKWGVSAIIFFALVAVACVILINGSGKKIGNSNSEPASGKTQEQSKAVTRGADALPGISNPGSTAASSLVDNVYSNKDYGFQLTFSDEWSDRTTENAPNQNITALLSTIQIKLKSQSEAPLTVYVFDKNQFAESSLQSLHATKLEESSKYVFAYSTWEKSPTESTITDKSISKLIDTFKLI